MCMSSVHVCSALVNCAAWPWDVCDDDEVCACTHMHIFIKVCKSSMCPANQNAYIQLTSLHASWLETCPTQPDQCPLQQQGFDGTQNTYWSSNTVTACVSRESVYSRSLIGRSTGQPYCSPREHTAQSDDLHNSQAASLKGISRVSANLYTAVL